VQQAVVAGEIRETDRRRERERRRAREENEAKAEVEGLAACLFRSRVDERRPSQV
jgi:hypothetical protein